MQVMDCDRYSQNDAMGEVRINIDEMDLTKSVEVCLVYFYPPYPSLLLILLFLIAIISKDLGRVNSKTKTTS